MANPAAISASLTAYCILCYFVGNWAKKHKKNIFGWTILSAFITPVLAVIILFFKLKSEGLLTKIAPPSAPVMTADGRMEPREVTEIKKLISKNKMTAAQNKYGAYLGNIVLYESSLNAEQYAMLLDLGDAAKAVLGDDEKNELQNRYGLWTMEQFHQVPRPFIDNVPVNFKKGEKVYYCSLASLKKWKTVTERAGFGGISFSFPIAKGIRYRVGAFKPIVNKKSVLTVADFGHLVIADQRIFFIGKKENFSIRLDKIMQMGVTDDGLVLQRENSAVPRIIGLTNYELALTILSALVNDDPISFLDRKPPLPQKTAEQPHMEPPKPEAKNDGPIPVLGQKTPLPQTAAEQPSVEPPKPEPKLDMTIDDIPKLKNMLDNGLISREAFGAAVKKIMDQESTPGSTKTAAQPSAVRQS